MAQDPSIFQRLRPADEPRNWGIHFLLNLMVGQFKIGDAMHSAALVGELTQCEEFPVLTVNHWDQVCIKTKAKAAQLVFTQSLSITTVTETDAECGQQFKDLCKRICSQRHLQQLWIQKFQD